MSLGFKPPIKKTSPCGFTASTQSVCSGSSLRADADAAILFYSTDYDELIGCCDRVLVMYDGAIKRELVGDEITERALIGSALNIGDGARPAVAQAAST